MSKIAAVAQALNDNPELRAKVASASSAEERAAHLRDHGVEVPTHADVNEHLANLDDVDGAGVVGVVSRVALGMVIGAAASA